MASATVTSVGDRFLGIDRRTIGPSLLVLALAVWMGVVLPLVDGRTSYRHEIHEGAVVAVADGITLVPASGWNLASGTLVGHSRSPVGATARTELVEGSVHFTVQAAPFSGTASALLTRVDQIDADLNHAKGAAVSTTDRYGVTTTQGTVGVAEDFVGVSRQGSVVAFVLPSPAASGGPAGRPTREGVEVVVAGPKGTISRHRDQIVAMIRSVRTAS